MKTKFLFLMSLILGLGFYSCSSDDIIDSPQVEPEAKMQVVSFNLEEFKDVSNLRSTSDEYSIAYLVYENWGGDGSDNRLVRHKTIKSGELKTIKDTLLISSYTVVMIATDAKMPEDNLTLMSLDSYKNANIKLKNYNSDVLFTSFELSVGEKPIEQNITLERIVSKIDISVQDYNNFSENLLGVTVGNDFSEGSPNTFYIANQETIIPIDASEEYRIIRRDEIDQGALKNFSFNVFQTKQLREGDKFNLTLIVATQDKTQGARFSHRRIKQNIVLEGNQILKLSGKLFENTQDLEINLNTTWGETITESFDPIQ